VGVEADSLHCHREGQGVMVRVECGPRDAMRRECVLAVSKKAGEVAERQTLPVPPPPPNHFLQAYPMQVHIL
jgi:hypothetical protein